MNWNTDWDPQGETDPSTVYKYTEEEVAKIIKDTVIKNCKEDACFDKFFELLADMGSGKTDLLPGWHPRFAIFERDEFLNLDGVGCLIQGLISDLERLVPGYFSHLPLAASDDEKFKSLLSRLRGRFRDWQEYRGYQNPGERDDFDKALLEILAQSNFDQFSASGLTDSGSTYSGPADSSLHQNALAKVLGLLRDAVEEEEIATLFSCGGSVSVNAHKRGDDEEQTSQTSPPVVIFWNSECNGNPRKIVLPQEHAIVAGSSTLEQLVGDCAPATFGLGNKDVLDSTYRNAGKLDANCFCTSFHPADFGILDIIEQILLPSVSSRQENELQLRRVRAELYKLNIYSGPAGLFRKHVDTPRSSDQFGSLVVCLPSLHEGGNLAVRHNGNEVEFDWSQSSSSEIQWAAFYSDCEHEIKRVTKGHRLTLTYNLYITEPIGSFLSRNPIVQPQCFPLYDKIKALLYQPSFFPKGGVLGFFCAHSYAHTSSTAECSLPRKLKGSDMVLFAVLESLGLAAKVRPVMEYEGEYFPSDPNLNVGTTVHGECGRYASTLYYDNYMRKVEKFRRNGDSEKGAPLKLSYMDMFQDFQNCNDVDSRWKILLMGRNICGGGRIEGAIVGTGLHGEETSDRGGHDGDIGSDEIANLEWPHYFLRGVTWLTKPKVEMRALSHLTYGNEPSMSSRYSCAAILAIVPPWNQRNISTE